MNRTRRAPTREVAASAGRAAPPVKDAARRSPRRRSEVNVEGLTRVAGYLIRQAQLWVFEDFVATLAPLALRPAQYSMLVVIRDNAGLSQMALAEVLGIGRSGIIPPLDYLQARGLLERTATSDRRTHALHLTAAGNKLLAEADRLVAQHEQRLMEKVGPRGYQQLLRVLGVFGMQA